jgi:PEGA domain
MKVKAGFLLLLLLPLATLSAQTTVPGSTSTPSGTTTTGTTTTAASSTSPTTPAQAGSSTPDFSVPVDKKEKWVAGFCAFNAERLPAEDKYLTYSIPLMLKDQLSGLTTHTLEKKEQDLVRKDLMDQALQAVDEAITGLFKERDALLLNSTGPDVPTPQPVDDKIKAALARRDFLKKLDVTLIKVADRKPVEIKEGTGVGKLFDALSIPASVFCERQGIDFLVGGMVREVEGYILLDVWAYDAEAKAVVMSYQDAARREEVYQSVPDAGRKLTGLILGRPWASLAFTPVPPGASLYVDGKLVATGQTPVLYLEPGKIDVKVSAPGYKDLTETMSLVDEQEASLAVTLEKQKTGTIIITSTPPGADVYVESVWKGKTPLALDKPFERTRVDITQQGFYDQPFSISDSSPAELSFILQPDTISRDALQKKARDDFYNSFAWFVVSLPIPLFSYAFALDSAVQMNELIAQGNNSQARSAQATANFFYGTYIAGTVVSVSLFTWMIFRIIYYVSVSTRTAG